MRLEKRVADPQPGIACNVVPGDKFGRLEIIRELPGIQRYKKNGFKDGFRRMFECKCVCGEITKVCLSHLRGGHTSSCVCLSLEMIGPRATTHAMSKAPEYRTRLKIIERCGIDKNYLTRSAFFSHIGKRPSCRHSVDRIDNDGNYEPGNVRWATRKVQSRNTSRNVWVDYRGERKLLIEVSEELGLKPEMVRKRIRKGITGDRLFAPSRSKEKNIQMASQ